MVNNGLITITNPNISVGAGHTVIGDFEQTASGVLGLRVDATGLADFMFISTGTVKLDGTLRMVVQPGLYENVTVYSGSTAPVIFCNCASVTGTFANVVSSSPFFTATASYATADEIDVTLTRLAFGAVPGMTPNQRAVGNALEPFYSTSLTGNAATLFSNLLGATSLAALNNLSGEGTSGTQGAAFDASALFNNAMMAQGLNGENTGATTLMFNPTALGYAPTSKPKPGHDAFAALKQPYRAAPEVGRFRVWTSGFGSTRSVNGDAASPGSANQSQRSAGGAFGFDYQVRSDLLIGFAAGGSESNFSVSERATDGRLTGAHVGLYAIKTWGAFYAAGTISYARFDNTTNRTITGVGPTETATGRFSSDKVGGRLELGWKRHYARYTVTPFVAIEPAVLWQQGYTETSTQANGAPGILGLTYAARTTTSFPTFLGVQLDTRHTFANGMLLTPYTRVSWVHEFQPDRQVTATFIALPAAMFTVDGARAARDSAKIDAGARLVLRPGSSLFANVSGEFSGISQSYTASAGYRGFW